MCWLTALPFSARSSTTTVLICAYSDSHAQDAILQNHDTTVRFQKKQQERSYADERSDVGRDTGMQCEQVKPAVE